MENLFTKLNDNKNTCSININRKKRKRRKKRSIRNGYSISSSVHNDTLGEGWKPSPIAARKKKRLENKKYKELYQTQLPFLMEAIISILVDNGAKTAKDIDVTDIALINNIEGKSGVVFISLYDIISSIEFKEMLKKRIDSKCISFLHDSKIYFRRYN